MTYAVAYILVLIFLIAVGYLIKPKRKLPFFLFLDFIISIPSFFTKTPDGMYYDQDRFNILLNTIRGINKSGLINGLNWSLHQSDYANEPGSAIYVWIFSLFKDNGMLRLGTTFIFLALLSFLIIKAGKKVNFSEKKIVSIQLIVLLTFNIFYEISGIRNFLAFMILSVALYCDMLEKNRRKKWVYFVFYLLAYTIHSSMLPFIIFRLVLLLHNRVINIITACIALTYNYYLPAILQWLGKFSIFSFFTNKASFYLGMQQQDINFSGGADITLMSIILVVLVLERVLYGYTFKNQLPIQYINYYDFILFYIIGSITITQVYIRTIFFLLFLSIPFKIQLFSNLRVQSEISFVKIYRILMFGISIMVFIIWTSLYYVNVLV